MRCTVVWFQMQRAKGTKPTADGKLEAGGPNHRWRSGFGVLHRDLVTLSRHSLPFHLSLFTGNWRAFPDATIAIAISRVAPILDPSSIRWLVADFIGIPPHPLSGCRIVAGTKVCL